MPEKPIVTEIAVKNQQTSEYEYADIGSSADKITYDNSSSQLEGETVQAAIDEVNTKIGNKSTVSVTPTLVSGTQVGTISVNGTGVNLYAPTPIDVVANPSASGELDNLQQITIGSTSYNIPQGNSNVEELDDLSDVSISNPSSGDVLTYNGTEWHAAPAQGGGGSSTLSGLSDVDLSSLVDGQVLKYDETNQKWVNVNESTGSTVVWNQITLTGTKIATVSIDGTPTDVYAPTSGGGGGATSLAGLDDVTVSSASNDQDLSYDSTSSKWINKTHRVELTKAQYDALPSSKLTDGIEYFITDMETTGVEIVANPEDTATDTLTKLQIGDEVYDIDGGGGSASWKDITGTLTAGQTSITLSNGYISDNCTFDFYTSKFGVNPTDVSVSNGSITLIFDEQEENINIKVRLYDYIIPTFKNYAKFNGTGIVLPFEINSSYKIICDFYETTYQTGQCIVGDTYSESVSGILLYTDSNSYVIGHGGYSGINSIIASWSSGLHNIIVNNDSSQCVLDNTNTESFTPTTLSNYYYTVGCKVNANTRPYYGYIKEYKIESLLTGDVICDLKPAIVNNNACLFDIITGDIYTATNMTVVDIIPSE